MHPMRAPRRITPSTHLGPKWITPAQLARFATEGTDAHRLASSRSLWIERFGEDILISYQREPDLEPTREVLAQFIEENALKVSRIFGRFLPRQNDDRVAPVL